MTATSHGPMVVNWPAEARVSFSRSSAARGRISSRRFVRARSKTTGIRCFVRSCCADSFRSTVMNASNSFSARASNSPFLIPAQPRWGTVKTSWPGSSSQWPGIMAHGDTREDAARQIQIALDGALEVAAERGIKPPAHAPAHAS